MVSIVKANRDHSQLLSEIARLSFIESHGSSGKTEDINIYVNEKYNYDAFKEELTDEKNIYYIIYNDKPAAGYSKITFNSPYTGSEIKNITKLERIADLLL
jgi:diamine N-acetyltransferase